MPLLEIILPNWVVIVSVIVVLILGFNLAANINQFRKDTAANQLKIVSLEGTVREKDLFIGKIQSDIQLEANNKATLLLTQWKESELENQRKIIFEDAKERAKTLLSMWMMDEEKKLRKDAVIRSMGVNFGKITEHLLPFSHHLAEFDPRDIRFIGSPVDLMIFAGATAQKSISDIYFVEIKTGSGQLSKKQKSIKEAIDNRRIHWKPIIVPEFQWDVPDIPEDDEPGIS
jgi:predicted Holliday junction resolvase-like endonuclease